MDYVISPITPEDEPFLWRMLYEAAHLSEEGNLTMEDLMNNPELAKYVKNWDYEKDTGYVASLLPSYQQVGAAWLRLLTEENKGYGYVNNETPELAIAVLPEYRNHGIGTQLLHHLLAIAPAYYPSISLSIRSSNPALHLYQRLGWQVVEGTEIINRVGGTSFIMKIDFAKSNLT
ncbi:GNAT family N-acetyltransferase [Tolypothrix sp. LEGE 11397]|nr:MULTISPECIES: GNAT family N-acetyltransferase [unclassified Tolypothrix]EKF02143.1 acetyltransferase, GNAT family [Tolypothrix sp. PCC 7601]BAY88471.1 GCN5-related N-acetyltransferase [Microchaete diplosiphon NIES-3275]MBE9084536.1 GNAT family N-acetyltransferase [Tolypothrix sp. LEGE 11397]UYD29150.1 GNAT family N-acetyltransferase [Tolypothrix sp. PCC 7712]UYD34937.1 GNAT family N-acetyltransferase [Tolypothrix sp. PCC 7601]